LLAACKRVPSPIYGIVKDNLNTQRWIENFLWWLMHMGVEELVLGVWTDSLYGLAQK
jgi:hypothetical protein